MKFLDLVFKKNSGFSLPELMIGGALLAGVGMAGATLFKNQRNAQRALEHELELNSFHERLSNEFQNTQVCNMTFRNYVGQPSIPRGPLSLTDPSKGIVVNATGTDLIPLDSATNKRWISPKRIWQISSLGLPHVVTSSGELRMHVFYRNDSLSPVKTVRKDLIVGVRFKNSPNSRFTECVNPLTSTINSLQVAMCKALNPNRTKAGSLQSTHSAVWDDTLQQCVLVEYAAKKECPAGQLMKGYTATGDPVCVTKGIIEEISAPAQPLVNCQKVVIRHHHGKLIPVCDDSNTGGPITAPAN